MNYFDKMRSADQWLFWERKWANKLQNTHSRVIAATAPPRIIVSNGLKWIKNMKNKVSKKYNSEKSDKTHENQKSPS